MILYLQGRGSKMRVGSAEFPSYEVLAGARGPLVPGHARLVEEERCDAEGNMWVKDANS